MSRHRVSSDRLPQGTQWGRHEAKCEGSQIPWAFLGYPGAFSRGGGAFLKNPGLFERHRFYNREKSLVQPAPPTPLPVSGTTSGGLEVPSALYKLQGTQAHELSGYQGVGWLDPQIRTKRGVSGGSKNAPGSQVAPDPPPTPHSQVDWCGWLLIGE